MREYWYSGTMIDLTPELIAGLSLRQDGWQNVYSGLGTTKDRREATALQLAGKVDYEMAKELFRSNAFAKKIAALRVEDSLRDGWKVDVPDKLKWERKINKWLKDNEVFKHVTDALVKMRWSGGGAIFPIINGGKQSVLELSRPLDWDKIDSIDGFRVFTSEEFRAIAYYNGMLLPKYGETAIYRTYPYALAPTVGVGDIENPPIYNMGTLGSSFTGNASPIGNQFWPEIHESRVIVFSGPITDARQRIERWGWGDTCFDSLWDKLRDFDAAFASVSAALDEFSVCVYKFAGLTSMLDAGTAPAKVKQRLSIQQMGKSLFRAVVLNRGDATGAGDETLERLNVPFTGIYEVLSLFMSWVSGAADYPVTRLFAQSPKGLGNEGESDIKNYNSTLTQFRTHEALPGINRLLKFIFAAKRGPTKGQFPADWDIVFPPLHSPTQKEMADTNLVIAKTDEVLIKNEILSPEEARNSHFSADQFSPTIEINDEAYEKWKRESERKEKAADSQGFSNKLAQTQAVNKPTQAEAAVVSKDAPSKRG